MCPFSLTRSRVAVLKGSQFPSQLFEAQNCHPRSHLLHFICPFSFSFSPLPSVLRVPLLPFHGGNLRRISTLQVLSVLKCPGSAFMARLLRWLRGWQKATSILHVISGQACADVSMLSFRDSDSFVAGNLQNHFPAWELIANIAPFDLTSKILLWIKNCVDVHDFFQPYRGENFDSALAPHRIFSSASSCKPFAQFISDAIID